MPKIAILNDSSQVSFLFLRGLACTSAGEFFSLSIIGKKLMHDHPEEMQKHLERIKFIMKEAPRLVEVFLGIAKYANKFGISPFFDSLDHLAGFANNIKPACREAVVL